VGGEGGGEGVRGERGEGKGFEHVKR